VQSSSTGRYLKPGIATGQRIYNIRANMFQRQSTQSSVSASSSNGDAASISSAKATGSGQHMLHRFASTETLSVLSRSVTATSINSTSTINTTFETNWLPNSFVVSKKKYKISLKLKQSEIELLRKSWAIVTSNDARATDNTLERAGSRSSNNSALKLSHTITNSSNNSGLTNNTGSNVTTPVSKGNQGFNTASFSSFLFCIQFYNNLIGMDAEIETLIPSIRHQASAFAGVISVAIGTLEDLSKMKESLLNLGHLHARILGIDSPYFKTMGNALIKTFQDWFGNSPESFPLELEEAWIKLYCFLANSIIQGGVDPVIEYNLQPARTQGTRFDETDENEDNEKDDQITNMDFGSNFASSSMTDVNGKKTKLLKQPHAQSGFYEPSVVLPTAKPSYIPNVASKNYNRLKKNKGTKEDCTIM
jgi:hemoglobin-like flavoprotein